MARRETSPPAILLGGEVTAVAVARSLGSAGVPVYALGAQSDPVRKSRFCVQFADLGTGDDLQGRWLEWLSGAPCGAVVLPCSDEGLELVAHHRSSLLEVGLVPIEADDNVLLAMLDKQRTYELAAQAEIPVPRMLLVRSEDELQAASQEIEYPCALKPLSAHLFRRHFSAKGFVAHNKTELESAFKRTSALEVETMVIELIPGPDDRYQSCYSYLDQQGEPLFVFTKRKLRQYPIRFGSGCYHLTDHDQEVADLGIRFFQGVGLRGLGNVEFKRDSRDETLRLIECNYRFTEATGLIRAAGVDLPLFTYNRLVGRPAPQLGPYRKGLGMWYPLNDFRAFKSYRREGELSFARWARSLLRPQRFPLANYSDPFPALAAAALRLRNARRKLGRSMKRSGQR